MEKYVESHAVVDHDEDLMIDLGVASEETKGAMVHPFEDEGIPPSAQLTE